jgi:ABC-2 type transport system permease protein
MSTINRMVMLALKEALQLIRDPATLGMLLGVPLIQFTLFGFAVELTPRTLSVTVVASQGKSAARIERWLKSASFGARVSSAPSLQSAQDRLRRGETLVVVDANEYPARLYVDATDPVLYLHAKTAIDRVLRSLSAPADEQEESVRAVRVVELYNPGARTQPYLVSGLVGLILTMTLVMMSALTVARERERGTLESLLALRVRSLELCIGKLTPYLLLGFLQGALILAVARLAFEIPLRGSLMLIAAAAVVFAGANLALGFLFSTLARVQMQAMQMTFFFFLPSSLLSGFMFPFSAMPAWARVLGETLPLTHFLRIIRGVTLRNVESGYVIAELAPIAAFAIVVGFAALVSCRRALRAGPA